ncbi:glutamyl-tRNA reductase [Svornostia abyssi]|uniref:Glutamyl-tRNA reductase n=1 Tax=Svornostia abyssi TaxID=2898438 RepID=A0ABY5PIM3_9ACTN|nr:glutamyl-tRNA reductase [Parviterribacteraceae bacterium J379]
MSELLTLGISHKTAPVELRERLALTDTAAAEFLQELSAEPAIREAVAISTCNRTEITVVVGDPVAAESELLGWLARRAGIRPTELGKVMYSPRNCDAARQLFRVTSGLESMIVGEAEVQGQVKRAYETALAAGTAGPLTNRLFTAALQTGKRVRTETKITEGHASVSSVAVSLAEDTLGELTDRHVVIIGAGETSELTARALHERGVTTMFVANRRADRARSLADRFGGDVIAFDKLPTQLEHADIVVAQTASPHPIIDQEELELVMKARDGRPLLLIDIAVPRDVDPACADIPGVTLFDVDDLQGVVRRTTNVRGMEARRAEEIVEEEIERFAEWLGSRAVLPTIAALRQHGTDIVEQVLGENEGRWESASPADLARVEAIARAVMNRLLHEPTIRLKATDPNRSHGRLSLVRELFGMDEGASVDVPEAEHGAEVRSLPRRGA